MVFGGGKPKQLVTTQQYMQWRRDPFVFIKDVWGLVAQPDTDKSSFIKGQMITRQQKEIVQAVKDAVNGLGRNKITVRSGRGIGKDAIIAMIIQWFILCFMPCKVPCTAPTENHLNVTLWNEIKLRNSRMPKYIRELYEITSDYVRIAQNKDTQFAVAKVGKKENAEGMAGLHSEFVLAVVDEASGVADEIFQALQGIFSSGNVIMLLISNPTRLTGYFHDSHCTKLSETFKCLHFNGEESPIVDKQLLNDITARRGKDSEQYRIDVLGEFPNADSIDDKGYIRLLMDSDIHQSEDSQLVGQICMGVDPAGEGDDETVRVIRDAIKARLELRERMSTGKGIAQKTATLMTQYKIKDSNVVVDNFGVGVDAIQELAMMGYRVNSLYVGKMSEDKQTFLNKRAELYRKVREWLKKGGELVKNGSWDELTTIKYRRTEGNQIQIKPKKEMRDDGIKSPNCADALSLSMEVEFGPMQDIVSQVRTGGNEDVQSNRVNRWIAAECGVEVPDKGFYGEWGVDSER